MSGYTISQGLPVWFYIDITLRAKQNSHHSTDDIFKRIFMNEKFCILIKISLKFVPEGSVNNIPALDQIMAWRRPGDKPLSEPMMVRLLTYICISRPQWDIWHISWNNLKHIADNISQCQQSHLNPHKHETIQSDTGICIFTIGYVSQQPLLDLPFWCPGI